MSDLIDTTEMYLRTVFELEEDGIVALRARIAQRLDQSGPTVSQTVSRMERDGLLTIEDDRHLQLTPRGRHIAEQVMRRHRLAECMLVETLGVEISRVHEEACRLEHVMSELLEEKISQLLNHPKFSPFGNAIPGISQNSDSVNVASLSELIQASTNQIAHVVRVSEVLQEDEEVIATMFSHNIRPGHDITISRSGDDFILNGEVKVSLEAAHGIWVRL